MARGTSRELQRSPYWATAKALRALGAELPDGILDDEVVLQAEVVTFEDHRP